MNFGTVAILGPGLIGGSLALALTEKKLADRVVIYARKDASFPAIRAKLPEAKLTLDINDAVRDADVVVLCVPIETMADLVKKFADSLKPTALVTDVGSVKGIVENEIAPLLAGKALWVGSHPMAGSEQAGFSVARPDLFVGAAVIVTPTRQTDRKASDRAEELWAALGANLVVLSPTDHDQKVAAISHIPHLMASVLVNHAIQHGDLDLAAGGFRDTTRIASGSPELWAEILMANKDAVGLQLGSLIDDLETIRTALERDPVYFEAEAVCLQTGEVIHRSEPSIPPHEKLALKSVLLAMLKAAHDARSHLLEKKSHPNQRK